MIRKIITIIGLSASILLACHSNIVAQTTKSANLNIEAEIPSVGVVQLFGYTGPFSKVIAEGPRAYGETLSEKDGYYKFDSIFIGNETKELCVYSVDFKNRSTFPNCIPLAEKNITIGPVLLPPTISISDLKTQGQTIPNSTVEVIIADNKVSNTFSIIPKAFAFLLPKYNIKSDKNGNYSFNIPEKSGDIRVFSITQSKEGLTPKSQTLSLEIPNGWISYLGAFVLITIALVLLYRARGIIKKSYIHRLGK